MEKALREVIRAEVIACFAEFNVYNHQAWSHGEIVSVAADGTTASVKINADTAPTDVPIAAGLAVQAGDHVLILNIQRSALIAFVRPQ